MLPPLHFKWEWNLNASPLQLWPLLSDTNRFNRDAGLPSIETDQGEIISAGKILRTRTAGMLIEWEEKPFEWIAPFEFGVERLFKKGPIAFAKVKVSLRPHLENSQNGPRTRVIYESWVQPHGFILKAIVSFQMNWVMRFKIGRLLRRYDAQILEEKPPHSPDVLKNRLLIEFSKLSPGAAKLASYLESADDLDLIRIRPYELAGKWNWERRKILEVFLTAAHQRLLEFQWEIICPHCRGSEKRGASLEIISRDGYCRSCDLHYTVNFDQLIELTFRPNPKIRKISAVSFCTGGPKITPHIVIQQTVEAGTSKKFPLNLNPGLYRLRGVRTRREKIFRVSETSPHSALFKAAEEEISGPSEIPPGDLEWTLKNTATSPFLFAVEEMTWAENRVPGSDVLQMSLFRELFQTQCLRPNQMISSGELTIVFTDLKGSTKMYQEIGDPTAFRQVMNHFDILQKIINAHEGTVIKTIGDSVMAVFRSPVKAVLAMASAQKALAAPAQENQKPLHLKIGIHKGANLAVNLNNRMDYFGSSVNIAARLVSLSSGDDLIISSETALDQEVSVFLNNPVSGFQIEKIQTAIKGFGKEHFTLFRITAG